ncbi:hypothetical protein AB0L70_08830 [Kribbella sp. NPDC051952]|uniref:hypothetical protein n=1 Tax=Kribbella sp. NPDC051952 TaxID=3154851 RepID=UPI00342961F2
MSDSELAVDGSMVVGIIGGKLHDFREVGLPFQQEVIPALEGLGITNEDGGTVEARYPDAPPFPPQQGPKATILIEGALIGLGLYLVKKLVEPTIEGLGKQIYEQIVQPALERLWSRMRQQKGVQRPVTAQFDHWFDGSKVLVRVLIRCDQNAETPNAAVVTAALHSAAEWLQHNPVTHRVLTYEVADGKLPSKPKLSEPIEIG